MTVKISELPDGSATLTSDDLIPVVDMGGLVTKRITVGDLFGFVNPINTIGVPGQLGFGVGICPAASLPAGFTPMAGCYDSAAPNYGNYQYLDGSVMVWIPKFYYRLHEGWQLMTAATQANPVKITKVGHGLVSGDKIFICQAAGMTQLNDKFYIVTRLNDNEFTLPVDGTGFGAWSSGGYFCKGVGANYDFNPTLLDNEMNAVDIKGIDTFATTAAANALGYALHRMFIDGGVEKTGVMVDKFKVSTQPWGTGYIASSLKNGNPIATASAHNPVATVTASGGVNTYAAMLDAMKGRGETNGVKNAASMFFCCSRFIHAGLALLALAHGQAALGQFNCAWYSATTTNFPKGCNSGVLKDTNDADVTYVGDGYATSGTSFCGRTGSGVPFAKTTHNGQECGIADLNGLMYEVAIGITCISADKAIDAMSREAACKITIANHGYVDGDMIQINAITQTDWVGAKDKLWAITYVDASNFTVAFNSSAFSVAYDAGTDPGTVTKGTFYTAKQAAAMKAFTSGAALATDHWGATGVAAMMDAISVATVASMFNSANALAMKYGSGSNQVLDGSVSGESYTKTGLGLVKSSNSVDASGTNLFGQDYYYQYIRNDCCVVSCLYWALGSFAGVWGVDFSTGRATSSSYVGGRAACYPL